MREIMACGMLFQSSSNDCRIVEDLSQWLFFVVCIGNDISIRSPGYGRCDSTWARWSWLLLICFCSCIVLVIHTFVTILMHTIYNLLFVAKIVSLHPTTFKIPSQVLPFYVVATNQYVHFFRQIGRAFEQNRKRIFGLVSYKFEHGHLGRDTNESPVNRKCHSTYKAIFPDYIRYKYKPIVETIDHG